MTTEQVWHLKDNVGFVPRVLFSPDGSLAVVAGRQTAGTTTAILKVLDIQKNRVLCYGLGFNGNAIAAKVSNTSSGQQVDVTVDSHTTSYNIN